MRIEELASILRQYDPCPLDDDDLTRVLHTALAHLGFSHQVMFGRISHTRTGRSIEPHFWIELPNGYIVDYRVRIWLGISSEIPHGIFSPADYPLQYDGIIMDMEPLPDSLFRVLTDLINSR